MSNHDNDENYQGDVNACATRILNTDRAKHYMRMVARAATNAKAIADMAVACDCPVCSSVRINIFLQGLIAVLGSTIAVCAGDTGSDVALEDAIRELRSAVRLAREKDAAEKLAQTNTKGSC